MDLPTYTNIWRIEKRLYKLYDFRLPAPLPINWIAVFAGITIPYIVLLVAIGLPFNHTLVWLYVLPPGVLTWLTTRPVIENKRLPELVESQVRYLTEPRVWVRLAPHSEKDQIVVTAKVWHSRAPQQRKAGTVALRDRGTLARRNRGTAVEASVEGSTLPAAAAASASATAASASARSRSRVNSGENSRVKGTGSRVRGTGPQAPVPRLTQRNRASQQAQSPQRPQQPPARQSKPAAPVVPAPFRQQPSAPQRDAAPRRAAGAKQSRFRLAALRSKPAGPPPALPPGVALKPPAGPGQPRPAGQAYPSHVGDTQFGDPSGVWPGQPAGGRPGLPSGAQPGQSQSRVRGNGQPAQRADFAQSGPVQPAQAQPGPVWPTQALHVQRGVPSFGSVAAPVPSDMSAHATPDVYPAAPAPAAPALGSLATPDAVDEAPAQAVSREVADRAQEASPIAEPAPATEPAAHEASTAATDAAVREEGAAPGAAGAASTPQRVRGNGNGVPHMEVAHTGPHPRPLPPVAVPPADPAKPRPVPARPAWPARPPANAAASADTAVSPAAERSSATQAATSPVTPAGQDAEAPHREVAADAADLIAVSGAIARETAIKSSATPDTQPEQVAPVAAATSESAKVEPPSPETAEPADLSPISAAIATENGDKASASNAPEAEVEEEARVVAAQPPIVIPPPAVVPPVTMVLPSTAVQPPAEPQPIAEVQPAAAVQPPTESQPAAEVQPAEAAEPAPQAQSHQGQLPELPELQHQAPATTPPPLATRPPAHPVRQNGHQQNGHPQNGQQQNGHSPVVKAVEDTQDRAVPSIERALSGPSRDRNLTWHGKVKIVTGMGVTQGPGARDQEALDRTRARLPLKQPKRILVLGCTSGAGQTVTTMMTGHILASLREHPVAAVDLHDGTLARYGAPAAWLDEILRGKAPELDTPVRADGLHPKPKPNPARLDIIASHDPLRDGDELRLAVQLSRHYPLTMLDPGAAGLTKLLKVTDQLVVVVPASVEAAGALADTREWLDAHGFAELASHSVTLINGVSRRSLIDVENAESVVRGRCRAIVRVPWDDMLPVGVTGPSTLRPQTRVAYTALAGVLVAGMAAAPVRTKQ